MMNCGYRLVLLGSECGSDQIANAFDSNRVFGELLLVGAILLWLWAARQHASICTDNSTKKHLKIFIL